MDTSDVPRHRPLAFDKMEHLIKEMQHPETGVPVRSQKIFLSIIPSAFMGYDLIEWLMERFNLDETSNVEAINLANQLCQYGYYFPVNDLKNLVLKDDSSLYRFQTPYYWPWQAPRMGSSGSNSASLGPDNVDYAIYLVKRTLRNKQRHGLEEYEQEALVNLKRNLAAKWDFITMQAEEQVRLAKDRKKGDKIVSDSQERAYWRVARPPPGVISALDPCPVPVRLRNQRPKKRTIEQLTREIEYLKSSLDRTRVKTSIALEALLAYSETFTPYDPWLTQPQPSNPWVTDDTLFWQINNPIVEVASEKRVQRWALSINELLSDPTGLQEFTSFLRKEYSHENIRFWLAVMDLRRSSVKQIPNKLHDICEEFLKPGAPCEINIDAATLERVMEGIRSGSRYALDHAAEHVYGLLLKKDCYPRFIRSDHFQRLLAEGKNVHQKKAKFFNFGGQVKKKPVTAPVAGGGGGSGTLSRRRGSDRSLSGSAHELAVCAAQAQSRPREPPPYSHSQLNLANIRDPVDDETSDVAPWESTSREGPRLRQDSAADSSSSSDISSLPPERARRLPQQSTLDGGLRGAPPPLRRLSAVEPRHLTPLTSPPPPQPMPTISHPPHPTPTISVSSAPDDSPPGISPLDDPASVFTSADATPTDPKLTLTELSCDTRTEVRVLETDVDAILGTLDLSNENELKETEVKVEDDAVFARQSTKESPALSKDESRIGDLPEDIPVSVESSGREPVNVEVSSIEVPVEKSIEVAAAVTSASETSIESVPSVAPEARTVTSTVTVTPTIVASVETVVVRAPTTTDFELTPSVTVKCEPVVTSPDVSTSSTISRTVAPLAESEDVNVDDDKVPSTSHRRYAYKSSSEPDGTKRIAHKDDLTSVSDTDIVKRDKLGDRKQRNDICPWEDE